jgi:hypothetical protein
MTNPLWYRRSFVERLRVACPPQEIGLHGGLTHLIWTDPRATRHAVKWELAEGVKALERASVRPLSFSFGREQEAYHELLPAHGIRSYRGRTATLSHRLGPTLPGALLRVFDELVSATPPVVWPQETLPGLWNIPSSLFLYPIGPSRARLVALRSRVERFRRGLEAAARHRGIFHFCLHPENLAESHYGFSILDDILDRLARQGNVAQFVSFGPDLGVRHVWIRGYWDVERSGHEWVAAHWEGFAGHWRFVEGHWRPHAREYCWQELNHVALQYGFHHISHGFYSENYGLRLLEEKDQPSEELLFNDENEQAALYGAVLETLYRV